MRIADVEATVPMRIESYCGKDDRLWTRMAGLSSAIDSINKGLAQLGLGRVREGLASFKRDGIGFLEACHGSAGRLDVTTHQMAAAENRTQTQYIDIAHALKMDEWTVRMISYCEDEHPTVLHALAFSYVTLGMLLPLERPRTMVEQTA